MTKTQFNFALPTDLLSFVASKNDNSASTDPNMPATKSPDFYYEGVKADNTTQSVSLYYDVSDSYAKKLVVDGVTTNLDLVNADDAVTNISLEGSTNPLTFLFQTMDENVGWHRIITLNFSKCCNVRKRVLEKSSNLGQVQVSQR